MGHVSRDRERGVHVWQTRTRSRILGAAWERTLRIKIDCAIDPCVSIHQPSKTSIPSSTPSPCFPYWLMIQSSHDPNLQSPRYRWGYVIALIRDGSRRRRLPSFLASIFEGEETVVRASFNQRRLISISKSSRLSAPFARLLFFFSTPSSSTDVFLSSFLSLFLFSLSRFFARVHDRLSRNGA